MISGNLHVGKARSYAVFREGQSTYVKLRFKFSEPRKALQNLLSLIDDITDSHTHIASDISRNNNNNNLCVCARVRAASRNRAMNYTAQREITNRSIIVVPGRIVWRYYMRIGFFRNKWTGRALTSSKVRQSRFVTV